MTQPFVAVVLAACLGCGTQGNATSPDASVPAESGPRDATPGDEDSSPQLDDGADVVCGPALGTIPDATVYLCDAAAPDALGCPGDPACLNGRCDDATVANHPSPCTAITSVQVANCPGPPQCCPIVCYCASQVDGAPPSWGCPI
jgi:hypothetical protein